MSQDHSGAPKIGGTENQNGIKQLQELMRMQSLF